MNTATPVPRTSVLLGAGASVDAGLPLTQELAERLVEMANEGDTRFVRNSWVRSLNFVYGAMVGYQAEDGSNPLTAVNVERLISALRLLRNSRDHEVAPFVASWKPGALGVGQPNLDSSMGRAVKGAIGTALGGGHFVGEQELVNSIADIARAVSGGGNPRSFATAEEQILDGLSKILGELDNVDYLQPIADLAKSQPGGLDVLTLNYDLTVETMARDVPVEVDRGIERWTPGVPLGFEHVDERINLVKLHGSLDWQYLRSRSVVAAPKVRVMTSDPEVDDAYNDGQPRQPWIVVGDREKLGTDGPTLALMRAAEDALFATTHLVVVGYSFGDAHINTMIRDWLLGDDERTIAIVDTRWEDLDPFRDGLLREYGASSRLGRQSRIIPLRGTAAQMLAEALTAKPEVTPETYATASVESVDEDIVCFRIRLLGPRLRSAAVYAMWPDNSRGRMKSVNASSFVSREALNAGDQRVMSPNSWMTANFEHWSPGEDRLVWARCPDLTIVELNLSGYRVDGMDYENFVIHLESDGRDIPAPH
ncbi:SIR2 family protein [Glaciihabitans sp. dw_435]|uniref:SIR2 family protein n=1 Tax=Glaciihabitans sp. dw_435 TaxID=2720081 RepID=UPI001BD3EE64|nr:SIR2 family protein [Glaciihabitans sp. dw_435]